MCVVAVLLLLLITWLLAMFLPKEQLKDEFVIGGTTITKADIDTYEQELREYRESEETTDKDDGRSLREVAADQLIMNAGLKYYSKDRCGVEITEADVIEHMGYGGQIDSLSNMQRPIVVGSENNLYEEKLRDCVLSYKKVFEMSVFWASPEYSYNMATEEPMTIEESNHHYDQTKDYLKNNILPLFEQGKTDEEIASHANSFTKHAGTKTVSRETYSKDSKLESGAVIYAESYDPYYYGRYRDDITIDEGESDPSVNHDRSLTNVNDAIRDMAVGQHSDVLATSDGMFRIFRVNGETGGKFADWDDFLNNLKDESIFEGWSITSAKIKRSAAAIINGILGREVVNAAGICSGCKNCHNMYTKLELKKAGTDDNIVQAEYTKVRYKTHQNGKSWCDLNGSGYGAYTSDAQSANTTNNDTINCGAGPPTITISANSGSSYSSYYTMTSFANNTATARAQCPVMHGYDVSSVDNHLTDSNGNKANDFTVDDGWVKSDSNGDHINTAKGVGITCKYSLWVCPSNANKNAGKAIPYNESAGSSKSNAIKAYCSSPPKEPPPPTPPPKDVYYNYVKCTDRFDESSRDKQSCHNWYDGVSSTPQDAITHIQINNGGPLSDANRYDDSKWTTGKLALRYPANINDKKKDYAYFRHKTSGNIIAYWTLRMCLYETYIMTTEETATYIQYTYSYSCGADAFYYYAQSIPTSLMNTYYSAFGKDRKGKDLRDENDITLDKLQDESKYRQPEKPKNDGGYKWPWEEEEEEPTEKCYTPLPMGSKNYRYCVTSEKDGGDGIIYRVYDDYWYNNGRWEEHREVAPSIDHDIRDIQYIQPSYRFEGDKVIFYIDDETLLNTELKDAAEDDNRKYEYRWTQDNGLNNRRSYKMTILHPDDSVEDKYVTIEQLDWSRQCKIKILEVIENNEGATVQDIPELVGDASECRDFAKYYGYSSVLAELGIVTTTDYSLKEGDYFAFVTVKEDIPDTFELPRLFSTSTFDGVKLQVTLPGAIDEDGNKEADQTWTSLGVDRVGYNNGSCLASYCPNDDLYFNKIGTDVYEQSYSDNTSYSDAPADDGNLYKEFITKNDSEAKLCQRTGAISFYPQELWHVDGFYKHYSIHASTDHQNTCFYVPYLYENKPVMPQLGDTDIEAGEEITLDKKPAVEVYENKHFDGDAECSGQRWQLTRYVVMSGKPNAANVKGPSTISPMTGTTARVTEDKGSGILGSDNSKCQDQGGYQQYTLPDKVTISTKDAYVGDYVCYVLSVSSYSNDPYVTNPDLEHNIWNNAGLGVEQGGTRYDWACAQVVKNANLQLFGSNSWSGGSHGASCSTATVLNGGFEGKVPSKASGSWSQYGLLSTGDISNFGSGGILKSDFNNVNKSLANSIFANSDYGSDGNEAILGRYTKAHCMTDIYDYYNRQITIVNSVTGQEEVDVGRELNTSNTTTFGSELLIDVGTLPKIIREDSANTGQSITDIYDIYQVVDGNVRLTGTEIPNGRSIVLLVNGDATIDGDIRTANSFGNIYSIPQFTLAVTGNIIVEPTVHEIYGVYSAHDRSATDGEDTGIFYDCGKIDSTETKDFAYSGKCADYRSEVANSKITYINSFVSYKQSSPSSPLDLGSQNVGLTVNGAIIADGTRFQRTNGSENNNDTTPSERIRYTPLIYLQEWAYRSQIQQGMKTTLYREIAPRY
ncbi:MAG: hypothetical protein LBK50_03790 [Candidatus Nomurabacteria bacterium]|nr:hypothetical protein [Candidatus Nomurabacteria bacterium]